MTVSSLTDFQGKSKWYANYYSFEKSSLVPSITCTTIFRFSQMQLASAEETTWPSCNTYTAHYFFSAASLSWSLLLPQGPIPACRELGQGGTRPPEANPKYQDGRRTVPGPLPQRLVPGVVPGSQGSISQCREGGSVARSPGTSPSRKHCSRSLGA